MSEMNMGSDLELEIKVRARNLAKIAGRLMQGLGCSDRDAKSAMDWIFQKSIRRVEGIQYSSGRRVGYFDIEIDWEKLRLVVKGPDYRRTLPLNNSLLVEDQVKNQIREIIRYFEAKRRDLKVDVVNVIFTNTPGASSPPGFRPLTKEKREELDEVRGRRGFKMITGEYPELGIGYFEL